VTYIEQVDDVLHFFAVLVVKHVVVVLNRLVLFPIGLFIVLPSQGLELVLFTLGVAKEFRSRGHAVKAVVIICLPIRLRVFIVFWHKVTCLLLGGL